MNPNETILRELVRLYIEPSGDLDSKESVFYRSARIRREIASVEEKAYLAWCSAWFGGSR
jgi:hypothetical protein